MLTYRILSFQNFSVIDTRLSDFHEMTVTVLRSYLQKAEPKIMMYKDYKKFSNKELRLIINTENENLQNSNNTSLNSLINVCEKASEKVPSLK